MTINNDGSFTAHLSEVPIHFAIKALASGVRRMADSHDVEDVLKLADCMERFADHVKHEYGNI